jgi:Tol biopolymer transport system component
MPATGGTEQLVVSDFEGVAWSPTGNAFAFTRFNPEPTAFAGDLRGPEIWTIAADGSGERLLGGRADDGGRERLNDWIAWSPDGSVLAYTRAVGDELNTTEVDLISSAGAMRPLRRDSPIYEFAWLPDGSALAYYEQLVGTFTINVVVLSSSGEEFARFESPDGVPDRIIVSPDGSKLAWMIQGASKLRIQPTTGGDARTYETISGPIAWQPLLIPYAP